MTIITVTINWPSIHAACAQIDSVRQGIGHDGLVDPFGGSYAPYLYEPDGVAGLVRIHDALRMITQHAWKIIHSGPDSVRSASVRRTEDGYYNASMPLRDEDGEPMVDEDGEPVYTTVRRWSRTVAARRIAERVSNQISRIQAAVRVMLAARPLYDALLDAGIVTTSPESTILAGYGARGLNATGLLSLAGQHESAPATVEQARIFTERGLEALRASISDSEQTGGNHAQ